jgi:hypothetical protein
MSGDTRRGRCATCGDQITGVGTIMAIPAAIVIERYPDGPPTGIPDGAEAAYFVEPCDHWMTLLQLREAGLEVERYEHRRPGDTP